MWARAGQFPEGGRSREGEEWAPGTEESSELPRGRIRYAFSKARHCHEWGWLEAVAAARRWRGIRRQSQG